jgi:hypothetical protein
MSAEYAFQRAPNLARSSVSPESVMTSPTRGRMLAVSAAASVPKLAPIHVYGSWSC